MELITRWTDIDYILDNVEGNFASKLAVNHVKPDRTPVDFYAVEEIWNRLKKHFNTTDTNMLCWKPE